MFPLFTQRLPDSAAELERLLGQSLARLFSVNSERLVVRAPKYPAIDELRISLDRAKLRADAPRPPALLARTEPAFTLQMLDIQGANVSIGPAIVDLKLNARDVELAQTRDAHGDLVLVLQTAASGALEISSAISDIEAAVANLAKKEASKHGVTIEQVELRVEPRGSRGLDAELRVRARKLFFATLVQIAAKLDMDEKMTATVSGLRCHGEGTIGSLACGFLSPQLQKFDGRSLSLLALPLGEIRLQDIRIVASDRITVAADFGT